MNLNQKTEEVSYLPLALQFTFDFRSDPEKEIYIQSHPTLASHVVQSTEVHQIPVNIFTHSVLEHIVLSKAPQSKNPQTQQTLKRVTDQTLEKYREYIGLRHGEIAADSLQQYPITDVQTLMCHTPPSGDQKFTLSIEHDGFVVFNKTEASSYFYQHLSDIVDAEWLVGLSGSLRVVLRLTSLFNDWILIVRENGDRFYQDKKKTASWIYRGVKYTATLTIN